MLADYSPSAAAAAAAFLPRRRKLLVCFLLLLLFLSLYWLILYGAKVESSLDASGSSRVSLVLPFRGKCAFGVFAFGVWFCSAD